MTILQDYHLQTVGSKGDFALLGETCFWGESGFDTGIKGLRTK